MDQMLSLVLTVITAATPLLIASIGELVTERSGVLNLGVEGMMVMGAVAGFGAAFYTGSPYLGIFAAIVAGILMSLLFGFLSLTLVTNQVATGLAITMLGVGLSGLLGEPLVGQPINRLPNWHGIDILIPVSVGLVAFVSWFLTRTKAGLVLRATGDSHASAHALGYNVMATRYAAVAFGGACAGLAGAYLSLAYTPQWVDNMTAGRGWIALALVVFSSWLPWRLLLGAYLFGAVSIMAFAAQGITWGVLDPSIKSIPAQFLNSLPYLATVVALVVISGNRLLLRANTPACLGQPFVPDR
jgi:general nucleoside transport system permease protein